MLQSGVSSLASYLAAHVLLCLVPAFFIAGAMTALIPKEAITRYLGRDASKWVSYPMAALGGFVLAVCSCTILPLFAGVASKAQAARVVAHLTNPDEFWPPMPVPTIALDEPSYEPDMWRGPTWVNINSLIRIGLERYGYTKLSQEIRLKTLNEIDRWYRARGALRFRCSQTSSRCSAG